jgi:formylglycine-generating enzyme required for sulfatase activity
MAMDRWLVSRRLLSLGRNKIVVDPRRPSDSYDPGDRNAPLNAPERVTRGGSFLCDADYCLSCRPSARRGNDPSNPISRIGVRLVKDGKALQ